VDGPNPDRSGLRNNIGEVWVLAEHQPAGAEAPLRARGFLVVSPPNYIEWEPREDALNTVQQGGGS
jgi:quinohemoprotein amine dehydrogenase